MAEGNNVQPWKRPWTLEEIRANAPHWSLASDSGLYNLLMQMSQQVVSRTTDVEKDVNGILVESKAVDVQIQNAFNDFCMLANNQFIENLVAEEDPAELAATQNEANGAAEKSRDERQAELMPAVRQSLQLGLKVLEQQYERVEVRPERAWTEDDLDDEFEDSIKKSGDQENGTRSEAGGEVPIAEPIYQPKDPYEHRHLPHLIGSVAFREDDTLGIGFIDDEEEGHEDEEEEETESEASMETADKAKPRAGTYSSGSSMFSDDEEDQVISRPAQSNAPRRDNLFGDSESDSDEMFDDSEEIDRSQRPRQGQQSVVERENGDEETDSPIQPAGGLTLADELKKKLAKGKGESKERSRTGSQGASSPALLPARMRGQREAPQEEAEEEDDGDGDGIFGGRGSLFNPRASLFAPTQSQGLFDDDDEDEDVRPSKPSAGAKKATKGPGSSDEDDLFQTKKKPAPPAGATGIAAAMAATLPTRREVAARNHTAEKPAASTSVNISRNPAIVQKPAPALKPQINSIFDSSSEEDDLFSKKPAPKRNAPAQSATLPTGASKTASTAAKKGIFDDDDDLFAPSARAKPSTSSTAAQNQKRPESVAVPTTRSNPPNRGFDLFGSSREDDDADDLFSALSKKPDQKKSSGPSTAQSSGTRPTSSGPLSGPSRVTEEDEDEDDFIAALTKPKGKPSGPPPTTAAPKKSGGLFESTEEEEDDLFGGGTTAKPEHAQASTSHRPVGGVSMFGGMDPASFMNKASTEANTTPQSHPVPSHKDEEPAAPPPVKSKDDLFGTTPSDNEDDLFVSEKSSVKRPVGGVSMFGGVTPAMVQKDRADSNASQTSVTAPEVHPKPKPEARKKDLFEESDDLFASVKPAPVSKPSLPAPARTKGLFESTEEEEDLFSRPPVMSKRTTPPGDASKSTIEEQRRPAPVGNSSLFDSHISAPPKQSPFASSSDSGEDWDLVRPTVPSVSQRPTTNQKPASSLQQPITSAPAPKPANRGEDKDDLFASLPKLPPVDAEKSAEAEVPVSKPKFKPPAGAVSMFGGATPGNAKSLASEIKARMRARPGAASSSEESAPEEEETKEAPRKPFQPPAGAFSMFGGAMAGPPRGPQAEEAVASFEASLDQVTTLENPTKSRARLGPTRRPPTRRGASSTASTGASAVPPPSKVEPITSQAPSSTVVEDDIFASLTVPSASTTTTSTSIKAKDKAQLSTKADDDIFSSYSPTTSAGKKPVADLDDIFADVKSSAPAPPLPAKKVVLDDDDDDIFKDVALSSAKSEQTSSKVSGKVDAGDIFADSKPTKSKPLRTVTLDSDEEDLFRVPSTVTKPTESVPGRQNQPSTDRLFADTTDIFADLPTPSKSKQSKAKKKPPPIDDNIDDIFATKPSTKSSSHKKSKKAKGASNATLQKKEITDGDDPLGALS